MRREASLRSRVTALCGATLAVAICVALITSLGLTRNELLADTDELLAERAADVTSGTSFADLVVDLRGTSRGMPNAGSIALRRQLGARDDVVIQLLTPDGAIRVNFAESAALPVGPGEIEVTESLRRERVRTVDLDGEAHRLHTEAFVDGGAIQIARPIGFHGEVLRGLAWRMILTGVVGVALASLVVWWLVGRALQPVGDLTAAAEHVAGTDDLSTRIDVGGAGEVGRLTAAFNSMMDGLLRSRREQERLVMDASHELRTPLTSLRTNAGLLKRLDRFTPAEASEIVDDVEAEIAELADLVDQLVDLAAFRDLDDPVVDVDLGELTEVLVDRAGRRSDRSITLTLRDPETIIGHRGAIERAIRNLLGNATKFSPPDTEVDVTVTGKTVSVADRGPGVPPAERELIFDRFHRSIDARGRPGSGLGLAMVKEAAVAHGGEAQMRPRAGGGSVFVLSLGDVAHSDVTTSPPMDIT